MQNLSNATFVTMATTIFGVDFNIYFDFLTL